jgi:uncharacterized repeat protein (TIGR01451 family)
MVKDVLPGFFSSTPFGFTTVGQTVFFAAFDLGVGNELWKTDGTEAGTVRVTDANPGPGDLILVSFASSVEFKGTLFFLGYEPTHNLELWRSDGTEAGTVMVKDINPGSLTSLPSDLTVVGDALFFTADDGIHGRELWKTDGTEAGTVLVKDIAPGAVDSVFPQYDSPPRMAALGGQALLLASDGVSGVELWRSDGTAAGTVRVKDINPGPSDGLDPVEFAFTVVGGVAYFGANDGSTGRELWRSDGTAAGTKRVADINPGPAGSFSGGVTDAGGLIYFAASDGTTGAELWRSDGTAAGTKRVADINDRGSSFPASLTAAPRGLFFTADDGVVGAEPWFLDIGPDVSVAVDDAVALVQPGGDVTYRITVTNQAATAVPDVTLTDAFPAALGTVDWTCTGAGGASCTGSGSGDIHEMFTLPAGSLVTFLATGTLSAGASGTLSNTAAVSFPSDDDDPDLTNNVSTDVDVVGGALAYFTLPPCRLVDTRAGAALEGRQTRAFTAGGLCGVPASARAIAVNVTVTAPGAQGNLRVFPTGLALPNVATLNYQAGQTRGNNAIVALDAAGRFSIYSGQTAGTTVQVIVDVTGYFE